MSGIRVYIAGSHSTGKTTLARWISKTFGLPLVTEVARAVLAEQEIPLATLRVDLDRVRAYQREVFRRQAIAEDDRGQSFVSDRAFDNLAYAAHHTLALKEIWVGENATAYAERLKQKGAIVFFVRPHRDLLVEDGVRESPVWEEIIRIDGMVKLLLELHDIDYVTVDTLSMMERARTVRSVFRAAGLEPLEMTPPPAAPEFKTDRYAVLHRTKGEGP